MNHSHFVSLLFAVDKLFSFSETGIGLDLITMLLTGIISYGILIIIELGSIKILKMFILKHLRRARKSDNDDSTSMDNDVLAEKIRIEQMTDVELKTQAMVLKNVSKDYGKFTAVKNVSFSVRGFVVVVFASFLTESSC